MCTPTVKRTYREEKVPEEWTQGLSSVKKSGEGQVPSMDNEKG
jgi:hypothetical protein